MTGEIIFNRGKWTVSNLKNPAGLEITTPVGSKLRRYALNPEKPFEVYAGFGIMNHSDGRKSVIHIDGKDHGFRWLKKEKSYEIDIHTGDILIFAEDGDIFKIKKSGKFSQESITSRI